MNNNNNTMGLNANVCYKYLKTNLQTLIKCFNAFLGIQSLFMDHRTDLTDEDRMDQEFVQMVDHDRDRTKKLVRSGPV